METLSVYITTELRERLVVASAMRRVPMNVIVREAIDAYLESAPTSVSAAPPVDRITRPSARALPEPGSRGLFAPCEEAAE